MDAHCVFNLVLFILIYFVITIEIVLGDKFDIGVLDPMRNYKKWDKINLFGISVITLLINIALLPYAIIFWIVRIAYIIFTIGRRNDKK